jgi:hypothetical protein
MSPWLPAQFVREMGCTEAEWARALPQAIGEHPWHTQGQCLHIRLPEGAVQIDWQVLPPRAIALLRMPRLQVRFDFGEVPDDARQRFMQRFDLYMQRGGG